MRIGRLRFSAAHRKRVPQRKLWHVFAIRTTLPITPVFANDLRRAGAKILRHETRDYGRVFELIGATQRLNLPPGATTIAMLPLNECLRRFGP